MLREHLDSMLLIPSRYEESHSPCRGLAVSEGSLRARHRGVPTLSHLLVLVLVLKNIHQDAHGVPWEIGNGGGL